MSAQALRKIQQDLEAAINEPDGINPDVIKLAAVRIGMQAEAMEVGL